MSNVPRLYCQDSINSHTIHVFRCRYKDLGSTYKMIQDDITAKVIWTTETAFGTSNIQCCAHHRFETTANNMGLKNASKCCLYCPLDSQISRNVKHGGNKVPNAKLDTNWVAVVLHIAVTALRY